MVFWRRDRRAFADPRGEGVLRKASPERVTRRVREEEVASGRSSGGKSGGDEDHDTALLLPTSFEKATFPMNSYAEQEPTIWLNTKTTTNAKDKRTRLEGSAEGLHGGILSESPREKNAAGKKQKLILFFTAAAVPRLLRRCWYCSYSEIEMSTI
jgi:hypothetical protein